MALERFLAGFAEPELALLAHRPRHMAFPSPIRHAPACVPKAADHFKGHALGRGEEKPSKEVSCFSVGLAQAGALRRKRPQSLPGADGTPVVTIIDPARFGAT
jgi:hypothetical protein